MALLPASATHQKTTQPQTLKNNQRHLLGWSLADEFKTPDAISRKNPWAVSTGGRKFRHVKGRNFTPPSHTKCLSLAKCHPPLSRLRNTGEVKSWATPDHYRLFFEPSDNQHPPTPRHIRTPFGVHKKPKKLLEEV